MPALFQFHHNPAAGEPTLAEVATRYGLPQDALDPDYGVVLVSESSGLWVALIDDDTATALQTSLTDGDRAQGAGVFSNPRIEPYSAEQGG